MAAAPIRPATGADRPAQHRRPARPEPARDRRWHLGEAAGGRAGASSRSYGW